MTSRCDFRQSVCLWTILKNVAKTKSFITYKRTNNIDVLHANNVFFKFFSV